MRTLSIAALLVLVGCAGGREASSNRSLGLEPVPYAVTQDRISRVRSQLYRLSDNAVEASADGPTVEFNLFTISREAVAGASLRGHALPGFGIWLTPSDPDQVTVPSRTLSISIDGWVVDMSPVIMGDPFYEAQRELPHGVVYRLPGQAYDRLQQADEVSFWIGSRALGTQWTLSPDNVDNVRRFMRTPFAAG